MRFSCANPGASSFIELKPSSILENRLNGVPVDPVAITDNHLRLVDLRADNELVVRAMMAYSNSGEGSHRFTDPADNEVYLYAQAARRRYPPITSPSWPALTTRATGSMTASRSA
ncbi:MAG: aminopeptidase [Micromonosporaceae bacterium]|nr:aminopeptidase [Micromonosporaceae bacterium]